jgi:hypothetical protein
MTTNHLNDFRQRVTELGDYEFNRFNIMQLQVEMNKHLIHGIEECIIKLFDDLTFRHSYNDEYSNNIHYFTGWKTNESWIINSKKCIIPLNAYSSRSGNYEPDWNVAEKLADIEKALNYLDGGISTGENVRDVLNAAKQDGKTKNISFKYFDITFYKKGTCHIYWKDQNLMKKFNIFGSQKKGWLPPSYAKKAYNELTEEERIVIDDFEGEKSYNDTIRNPKYYAFAPSNMLRIEEKSA